MKKIILFLPILLLIGCTDGARMEIYNEGMEFGIEQGKSIGGAEAVGPAHEAGYKEGYSSGQIDCPQIVIDRNACDLYYKEGYHDGKLQEQKDNGELPWYSEDPM